MQDEGVTYGRFMQEALEALDKARSEMSDRQVKQGETHAASVEELQKQQDAAMRLLREEIGELQSSLAHERGQTAQARSDEHQALRHLEASRTDADKLRSEVRKPAVPQIFATAHLRGKHETCGGIL